MCARALASAETADDIASVHHRVAAFSDEQFHVKADLLTSPQWIERINVVKNAATLQLVRRRPSPASAPARHVLKLRRTPSIFIVVLSCWQDSASLRRQHEMDVQRIQNELATTTRVMRDLLELAVTHYMRALATGEAFDADVFRVVALWFGATAVDAPTPALHGSTPPSGASPGISTVVATELAAVPSSKFLPLTFQILSRSVVAGAVYSFFAHSCPGPHTFTPTCPRRAQLGRGQHGGCSVCGCHPHSANTHVLGPPVPRPAGRLGRPQRAPCRQGEPVRAGRARVGPETARRLRFPWHLCTSRSVAGDEQARRAAAEDQGRKTSAAERLCQHLQTATPPTALVRRVLGPMQSLCVTLRDLSAVRPSGKTPADWRKAAEATSEQSQLYVSRLTNAVAQWTALPPLSRPPPVDRSLQYQDVTTLLRFSDTFRMLDGNSHPRVLAMTLSDGSSYRELLKGSEDLRQDAVMQQAFVFINQRLQHRASVGGAALPRMRTYSVVPLSQDSGWSSSTPASPSPSPHVAPGATDWGRGRARGRRWVLAQASSSLCPTPSPCTRCSKTVRRRDFLPSVSARADRDRGARGGGRRSPAHTQYQRPGTVSIQKCAELWVAKETSFKDRDKRYVVASDEDQLLGGRKYASCGRERRTSAEDPDSVRLRGARGTHVGCGRRLRRSARRSSAMPSWSGSETL